MNAGGIEPPPERAPRDQASSGRNFPVPGGAARVRTDEAAGVRPLGLGEKRPRRRG